MPSHLFTYVMQTQLHMGLMLSMLSHAFLNILSELMKKRGSHAPHAFPCCFEIMRLNAVPCFPCFSMLFEVMKIRSYDAPHAFHRALVTRLLSQGYKVNRLSNTFKKLYGRHTDLVGQYRKDVCKCFLILSVEMIFIFDGFDDGQINKIS